MAQDVKVFKAHTSLVPSQVYELGSVGIFIQP